jgi:tetratricopeptide (TPR) repeat protein
MSSAATQTNLTAKLGPVLFVIAVFLAPLIGGNPAGEQFGGDRALHALRFLMLLAATLTGVPSLMQGKWPARAAWLGLVLYGGSAVASLLIHSKGLTSQVFLWTMLPGTLDILTHIATCLVAAGLWLVSEQRQRIVDTIQLGASLAAGMIIFEAISAPDAGHRSVGTFFSPNFAAGFIGAALPFVVVQLLGATVAPRRWTSIISLGMLGAALVATGSRGGIALGVGGVILTLLVAFFRDGIRVPIKWIAIGLGLFVIGAATQRGAILARTAGGSTQDHSGQFRSETWNGTIQMIQASPITGHGPGNFANTYGKYATVEWTGQAHNSYLQLASECGFPALMGLLLILIVTLAGQVRLPRKSTDAPLDVLSSALPATIIVAAARGLLDSESAVPGNALLLWVAIGCALATAGRSRFGTPGFGIAAVLGLVMASGATGWPRNPSTAASTGHPDIAVNLEPTARRWYVLGKALETKGDISGSVNALKNSVERDHNNQQVLRALAEAQEAAGDAPGALATWKKLIDVEEGLPGKIKAIPELTETHAVFAYAKLAAAPETSKDVRIACFLKALSLTERYLLTSDVYITMELGQTTGATLEQKLTKMRERRAALKAVSMKCAEDLGVLDTSGTNYKKPVEDTFTAYEARFDRLIGGQL